MNTCPVVMSACPRSSSAFEPLELDAVRLDRGFAEAALLVLLIGFEVALEPFDVAVALEGEDVRRQAIEEEAIVADHHGAAGEIFQRRLERAKRLGIEVVGRLVEQQQVAALLE